MRFTKWRRSKTVEYRFLKALNVLTSMFSGIAEAAHGDVDKYTQSMQKFQETPQYTNYITSIVKRMVIPLANENRQTWRKAAKASTKGGFFYELLKDEVYQGEKLIFADQVQENVSLIRTLPSDVANKVVRNITEEALKGTRARDIEKIIQEETDKHSRASARLIARTEVSKTATALTKARSEELDIKWYVWRTALDGDRVRKSHRNMEGVLVAWSNPPSPEKLVNEPDVGNYHAGNIWNCRCYPEPLLDIDDVKWPHKVYYQGTIQNMSKREFEQLM